MISPREYLNNIPVVPTTEGFLDTITGKSKPKPDLSNKNVQQVIRQTYKNTNWLEKI